MKNSYKDKVSIITGAASGLGLGIASELSKLRSIVIHIDIDNERLSNPVVENIHGPYELKIVDVTNFEMLEETFNQISKKYRHINYLFNNAGIGATLPFEAATINHWNKIDSPPKTGHF